MPEFDDSVMVALLPVVSDWAEVDYPHLTLVYAGQFSELSASDLDGLSKAALSIGVMSRPLTLRVLTKDVFGEGTDDNPKVDVLRFHPNLELVKMRTLVEDWNASQFPFNPHITVGPEGKFQGEIPGWVAFDKVAFVKGKERQEFRMKFQEGGTSPYE
jgi:2'-5' RNA ligase